jgi:hypothetical protein
MSMVEDLAAFVVKAKYEDLSGEARRQAKKDLSAGRAGLCRRRVGWRNDQGIP